MFLFLIFSKCEPPLGAIPSLWKKYEKHIDYEKQTFKCFDKKKIINLSYVNDNFKDCDDGSDEPGTTAANGIFYCKNERNTPKEIPKWLVSDGNCDCCDGSDEYFNPRVECPNTCQDFDSERKYLINQLENYFEEGMQKQEKIIEESMKLVKESQEFIEKNLQKIEDLNNSLNIQKQNIYKNNIENNHENTEYVGIKKIINNIFNFTFGNDIHQNKRNIFQTISESRLIDKENELNYLVDKYKKSLEITNYTENIQMFASLRNEQFTKGQYSLYLFGIVSDKYHNLGKFKELVNHTLYYDDGEYCFATKKPRKTTVEGHCWKDHKLVAFHEPETCVYTAIIGSPIFCNAESFKKARKMTLEEAENYTTLYSK